MTISAKSNAGKGSGAHGLCEPPQEQRRWTQGVTVPVECFRVVLTVHQQPGTDVYGFTMEVADPHTKELLAMVVEPTKRALAAVGLVSNVCLDLRAVLLELTDPEPF